MPQTLAADTLRPDDFGREGRKPRVGVVPAIAFACETTPARRGPVKLAIRARERVGPLDNLTAAERSKQMRLVRSKDTRPEMLVRHLVHRLGYRYRLHRTDLPGRPDLVFPSRKKTIFVHGCFWHAHTCRLGRMPKSHLRYWKNKIQRNKERDVVTLRRLRGMRWKSLVLWECQLRDVNVLSRRIDRFLRKRRS